MPPLQPNPTGFKPSKPFTHYEGSRHTRPDTIVSEGASYPLRIECQAVYLSAGLETE